MPHVIANSGTYSVQSFKLPDFVLDRGLLSHRSLLLLLELNIFLVKALILYFLPLDPIPTCKTLLRIAFALQGCQSLRNLFEIEVEILLA